MKKIVFGFSIAFLSNFCFSQTLTTICGQGYFSKIGGCIAYYSAATGSLMGYTQSYPTNALGLAIAPAFGFNAPNPTYWTTINGIYYYYNGSSFVSSGHSSGGTSFVNPGGSGDYIYNINQQGQITVYDGSSNATVLTTFSTIASSLVQDIAGDNNNNFYLVKYGTPGELQVYDHTGALSCTYSLNIQSAQGTGLAITNNKLYISYAGGLFQNYELSGNSLNYVSYGMVSCSSAEDFASCPSEAGLFANIKSSQPALTCTLSSLTLNSDDQTGNTSYSWSGPGISGSVNSNSIQVTAAGNYTRTAINCAGLQYSTVHKVKFDTILPALSCYQASKVKCSDDSPVMLAANGFSVYSWVPVNSLSNSTTSIVYANPSVTTTYSLTGYLNGCFKTIAVTVSASTLPKPVIASSADSVCKGNLVMLSVSDPLSFVWQPGNLSGSGIVVSPVSTTEFTATGTDALGCEISSTSKITVISLPAINTTVSDPEVCPGESITISNSGADTYVMIPGNYSGSSAILNPASTTVYTVTGTSWKCKNTATFQIKVNPLPVISAVADNKNSCAGDPVNIAASGAVNYLWEGVPGQSTMLVYPKVNTVYKITGVDGNGCNGEFLLTVEVNECTSVGEINNSSNFSVFPNPAQSELFIQNRPEGDVTVEVIDSQGRVVLSSGLETGSNKVQLQGVESGMYIVRITSGTSLFFISRVVIQ